MLVTFVLVGCYNVGKSTIFNNLTGTYNALIDTSIGTTRDKKYGCIKYNNNKYIIIDTGGFSVKRNKIEENIFKQTSLAIEEADIILFVISEKNGVTVNDHILVKYLYKFNKDIILLVNKVSKIDINNNTKDIYSLGIKNIITIYNSNKKKYINNFFKKVSPFLKKNNNIKYKKIMDYFIKTKIIKLAIIGQPNVGKSTIINNIVGYDRTIVSNIPGTTRDSIDILINYKNNKYIIVDTAGIKKSKKVSSKIEKYSITQTIQSINKSNIILLVIDAFKGINKQDLTILNYILKKGKLLIILINKWDKLSDNQRKIFKKNMYLKINFINFIKIHFISAIFKINVDSIFKSITKSCFSFKNLNKKLLTEIMNQAMIKHHPPSIKKRKVILKKAYISKYFPFTITICGLNTKNVPNFYKQYLIKYYQVALKIFGIKININFSN